MVVVVVGRALIVVQRPLSNSRPATLTLSNDTSCSAIEMQLTSRVRRVERGVRKRDRQDDRHLISLRDLRIGQIARRYDLERVEVEDGRAQVLEVNGEVRRRRVGWH